MHRSALLLAALAACAAAHGSPKTPQEVTEYLDRQDSLYHCYPVIASYVKQRKRSFAQRVLSAGVGAIPGAQTIDPTATGALFKDQGGDDFADLSMNEHRAEGEKILSCGAASEAKIRNTTCVLSPSTTQGPYYHDVGHPVRQNMAELQLGQLFLIDIGVIDVETCKPVPNVLVDIWHANSTGHYSGHADPAPHLLHEEPPTTGVRKGLLTAYPRWNRVETWLRAAWPTNKNGLSQFTSIFPGYYTGRATHVHIRVHDKWAMQENGTFISQNLIYTGQLFFDDELNMMMDKVFPYTENPISPAKGKGPRFGGRTRNWVDSLNIFNDSHRNGHSPVFELEQLGGIFMSGHIGYMTVGVNSPASYGYGSPEGAVLDKEGKPIPGA